MKIVHFLWGLNQGGAENLAVDLANEQARGHEVALVVGNDGVDPAIKRRLDSTVFFRCIGRPAGSRNPYWIARLLWVLRRLRPDIIHSHTRDLATLARMISPPMILTVHDMALDLSRSSAAYRRLCCISEAVFDDVRQRYPALAPLQIDNGIVVSAISTAADREPLPLLRGVQISRLAHEKKGQDLLIRALAALNARHESPRMEIDFIGDGPSLDYLRDLAAELSVGEQCRFLGALNRDEVYSRLSEYDLLVQPSRFEGFGLTVAEGMAAGIPVLVSNIEGPMEIIRNGEFGSFFECGNAESLSNALEGLARDIRSGSIRQRTIAARHHIEENYSLQRTAAQYCEVYRDVSGVRS